MVFAACTEQRQARLSGSPSQRFNNVSVSAAGTVAYVDRACVRVERLQDAGAGLEAGSTVVLCPQGAAVVMQCRYISVDCYEYLAVSSDAGLSLYDPEGASAMGHLAIDKVPENSSCAQDPTRRHFLWGVEGVQGCSMVAVGSSDGTIVVCDYDRSRGRVQVEHELHGHRRAVSALASSMSHLVSGDESGQVIIWSAGGFAQCCQFPRMGHPVTSVVLRADMVAASYASGVVRLYDLAVNRVVVEVDAHCRALNAMDIHLQHCVFATAGEDGFVNVWRMPTKRNKDIELISTHFFRDKLLTGVAFAKGSSSKFVVAAYDDRTLDVLE